MTEGSLPQAGAGPLPTGADVPFAPISTVAEVDALLAELERECRGPGWRPPCSLRRPTTSWSRSAWGLPAACSRHFAAATRVRRATRCGLRWVVRPGR